VITDQFKNRSRILIMVDLLSISCGILNPDGHLKIPHLWPGQNPPPEVSTYPPATGQNEFTDVGLKDPYFFPFSSKVFHLRLINGTADFLSPVASYRPYCHHTCTDSRIALVQTRCYVNISGVTPGKRRFHERRRTSVRAD